MAGLFVLWRSCIGCAYDSDCRQGATSAGHGRLRPGLVDLLLAHRTIMCSSSGDYNLFDGSLAFHARLALTSISAMLDLKKSRLTIGIHVIRNRRPAGGDGCLQNFLQCGMQLAQLRAGERMGAAAWPDMCAIQRFIGIDISHSMQQLLVKKGRFDGCFAFVKELREFFHSHLERFGPWAVETALPYLQAAKSSRVDKAQLPA